jgi:alkylation response protein AidB-like acyl-CoA dehydrogenase
MDLSWNETQTLLRDTVRQYLENEVPFSRVRECEKERRVDTELWSAICEQGWLATPFPAALGGGDGGLLEAGLLVEELARRATLVPALEVLTCALTLQRHGEGEAAAQGVRQVAAGQATPVPAILEAADRYDAIGLEVGEDGTLRGEKRFVDYAEAASHHLVAGRQGGEVGLFLVERADPGVKTEATRNMGRIPQARVHYDGARATRVAGEDGFRFMVKLGRALTCAQLLACMEQSLAMTVAYTNMREQFGRPLSTFQAVQHHGANMAMQTESSRFLTYEALDALERDEASDEEIALAKASLSRAVPEVTMLGHQLHGGQGFIEENDLYFFTLRGKDRSLAWGTAEECLEVVAASVEEKARWL